MNLTAKNVKTEKRKRKKEEEEKERGKRARAKKFISDSERAIRRFRDGSSVPEANDKRPTRRYSIVPYRPRQRNKEFRSEIVSRCVENERQQLLAMLHLTRRNGI